jgi:diaminohydroxyphosphoribosylaminopyrimidine deaminase/5-amino-6-(5-phosphoribosylamino)uracil reductase
MDIALRAARDGHPSPNPHVGAVVVQDGEPIAIGHHERAGEAHAEVAALREAGSRARGATLYVTFEPCNHFGRTPPCTEAIERSGVARVVIGCRDPAPHVPGAVERLRSAGIEVIVGVREARARALIADFTKHIVSGLPYVVLKAAVTLDGRMATRTGDSKWITGEAARKHAHRLRAAADAILIGKGTVLADDPELTVRMVKGRDPLRVVLDTHLSLPPTARLARPGTLVFHGPDAPAGARERLLAQGVELCPAPCGPDGLALRAVLEVLGKRDVVRLLVEGGPRIHGALLGAGLCDHASIFVAPRIVGDGEAPSLASGLRVDRIADAFRLGAPRVRRFGEDVLFDGPLGGAAHDGRVTCSPD